MNTKGFIIVCGIVFSALACGATSMEEGTRWIVMTSSCMESSYPIFELGGGKVFDDEPDRVYHPVTVGGATSPEAYVAEDGDKVYMRINEDFEPALLYDYGLKPGERVTVYSNSNGHGYDPHYMECTGRDKITNSGNEFDVIRLVEYYDEEYKTLKNATEVERSSQTWLVGFGSESGILYPHATNAWTGGSCYLISIEMGGKVIYKSMDGIESEYLTPGMKWKVNATACCTPDGPCEGYQLFELGDGKVFDDERGHVYYPITQEGLDFPTVYVREDGDKVYMRINEDFEPVLYYDYGLQPGDRVTVYSNINSSGYFTHHMICLSREKIMNSGNEFEIIRVGEYTDETYPELVLNDFEGSTQNWIVGYGSESGIVYPYATSGWSGASYSLDSIEQDGKVIYKAAPASVKDIAPDFVGDNKKYSLDGRRVSDDVRGLYISNGKVCFKK